MVNKRSSKQKTKQRLIAALFILFSLPAYAGFFVDDYKLLPEDQAFMVSAEILPDKLVVSWEVAPDYYMYKEQFQVEADNADLDTIQFSKSEIEDDPEFGKVEVYFDIADLVVPIVSMPQGAQQLQLTLKGQGCNKPIGVCYPPQIRQLTIDVPDSPQLQQQQQAQGGTNNAPKVSSEADKSLWSYLLAAFGAGVLLSFTPCVLPMVPILSGVIAGHKKPSKWHSGWLAINYVIGTAITYGIAGAVAGATGAQLQAYFQNPWAIGVICSILFLLALSLFGLFHIEIHGHALQHRWQAFNDKKSSAFSALVLGILSALIVGACVSPILILALGTVITNADPVLGAGVMISMALGMGVLLIAFGFGAGWLLPKAGMWMERINQIFGFMILGVMIYLLGVLPNVPVLFLWAVLLLVWGFFLWNMTSEIKDMLISSIVKALATISILWGVASFIGALSGNNDVLRPLQGFVAGKTATQNKLPFVNVANKQQLDEVLLTAKQNQQAVLIDFYADWCIDCVRMQRTTFVDANVQQALSNWLLIKVDVTNPQGPSDAIKKQYGVFGPPAMLFVDGDGREQTVARRYGYMKADVFLSHINALK